MLQVRLRLQHGWFRDGVTHPNSNTPPDGLRAPPPPPLRALLCHRAPAASLCRPSRAHPPCLISPHIVFCACAARMTWTEQHVAKMDISNPGTYTPVQVRKRPHCGMRHATQPPAHTRRSAPVEGASIDSAILFFNCRGGGPNVPASVCAQRPPQRRLVLVGTLKMAAWHKRFRLRWFASGLLLLRLCVEIVRCMLRHAVRDTHAWHLLRRHRRAGKQRVRLVYV